MLRKKYLVILMLLIVLFSCSLGVNAAKYNLRWAASSGIDYFFNRASLDTIEEIKQKTNGEIEIKLYPKNILGKDFELMDMLSQGTIDFLVLGNAGEVNYDERAGVYGIPFVFRDYDHILKAEASGIFDDILASIEEKGNFKLFNWFILGVRHLTTKDIVAKTPEDMKGVKTRCMPSKFYQDCVASLGGSATPVSYSELYMALQTGIVQAQENPTTAIYDSKLFEVQNNIILTAHQFYGGHAAISKKAWDSLPAEYQEIVATAFEEVFTPNSIKYYQEDEGKALLELINHGMSAIVPDREAFMKFSNNYMMDIYGEEYGDLIKKVQAIK